MGAATDIAWRVRKRLDVLRTDRTLLAAAERFAGAVALEPGGPSALFGAEGLVPVYPQLAALDTLDYAERTLWSDAPRAEAELADARPPPADRRGRPAERHPRGLLRRAACLARAGAPRQPARRARRVGPRGASGRPRAPDRPPPRRHLRPPPPGHPAGAPARDDAARETGEDDVTHVEEILALHDLERDPGAPDRETFERRCRENASTRAMHHHVFISRSGRRSVRGGRARGSPGAAQGAVQHRVPVQRRRPRGERPERVRALENHAPQRVRQRSGERREALRPPCAGPA